MNIIANFFVNCSTVRVSEPVYDFNFYFSFLQLPKLKEILCNACFSFFRYCLFLRGKHL